MPNQDLILFRLGDKWSFVAGSTSSYALFVNTSESRILKIKDKAGYSNLERIYFAYDYEVRIQLKTQFDERMAKVDTNLAIDWPTRYIVGTLILVPPDTINRAIAARDGGAKQLQKDTNYRNINEANAFMGSEIERYIANDYRKLRLGAHRDGQTAVRKEMPSALVMIWCRGLKDPGNNDEIGKRIQKPNDPQDIDTSGLYGKWIDVSKYVQVLETSVDDNGGNFSITLPPVQGLYDSDIQGWVADKATLSETGATVVGQSGLYERGPEGLPRRTEMFFKNAIATNDLVFISFEPLESDQQERLLRADSGDNIIRQSQTMLIPSGHSWDMIGLVDEVGQATTAGNNDISIVVSGRDLAKLIIEDGSYIYPLLWDEHNFKNKDSRLVQRNMFTNDYNFYAEPRYRSIQDAVKWIINIVSNIRIIPDNVAEAAGGDVEGLVERRIDVEDGGNAKMFARRADATDAAKRLADTYSGPASLVNDEDFSLEAFMSSPAGVVQLLTEKVKDIIGDTLTTDRVVITYADYYSTIALLLGLPPLGQESEIVVLHRGTSLGAKASQSGGVSDCMTLIQACYDLARLDHRNRDPHEIVDTVGGGVWRWVALLFDDSIKDRRLADVSLGRPDGSLINLIWNYAQAPWVEFLQDTWNDRFYFTFRTPPWNKKLVQEHLRRGWIDNVIVEDVDVLTENLAFDTEQYSIYQIDYKAATWGTNDTLASVIPTIPFPEIAEIWGNRRLRVSTNLLPLNDTEDADGALNRSYLRDKGIDDLIFVVDTTIYKPLTRKGTIVVNGDRRLKKGTWFLYKPTNEIFYITAVSQNFSASPIDRVTTIQVERGMVLEYVTGDTTIDVDGRQVDLTYFDIVDTEKIANTLKEDFDTPDDPPEPPPPPVDKIINDAVSQLQFETAKAIILPESFTSLNALAELLVDNPTWTITLAGHTDSDGSVSYNNGLSKRRTAAVALYLSKKGVKIDKIEKSHFGELKPIDTNETDEGKANNRRVEMGIIEKAEDQVEEDTEDVKDNIDGGAANNEDIFKINRPVLNFFLQRRQFGRENVKI